MLGIFITIFMFCMVVLAMTGQAAAASRFASQCLQVENIELENSDKVWLWSSFNPSPKVGAKTHKSNIYHTEFIVFVSRFSSLIEIAHQDEKDPSKCRFLVNKGGRSGALRWSKKMACRPGQNQRSGAFQTRLQLLATKQQISFGKRHHRPEENMHIGYDRERGRLNLTSLKSRDKAFWKINIKKHGRCIGI